MSKKFVMREFSESRLNDFLEARTYTYIGVSPDSHLPEYVHVPVAC